MLSIDEPLKVNSHDLAVDRAGIVCYLVQDHHPLLTNEHQIFRTHSSMVSVATT